MEVKSRIIGKGSSTTENGFYFVFKMENWKNSSKNVLDD